MKSKTEILTGTFTDTMEAYIEDKRKQLAEVESELEGVNVVGNTDMWICATVQERHYLRGYISALEFSLELMKHANRTVEMLP